MKRFACQDVIPGCDQVFTGADDQSVLDQVMAHAAMDHGLVKPPMALVELVVATTHSFVPQRGRGHLRLVGEGAGNDGAVLVRSDDRSEDLDGQLDVAATTPTVTADDLPAVVTLAAARFRRSGSTTSSPDGQVATADDSAAAPYRHECVFYDGIDEFLAMVVPFLRAGLELDQAMMVAVVEPRLSAVREALGPDAERVDFVDMAELGHNPARIIPAWREFVERSAGRSMRGVGEPIWAGRREAEIAEGQLHEALLNSSVDQDTPLWLLCPYDISALDQTIIDEAWRSHPVVSRSSRDSGRSESAPAAIDRIDYGGDDHFRTLFEEALPTPTGLPTQLPATDPATLATDVLRGAAAAGLPAQRSTRLATAVAEIVAAGCPESAVSVRMWREKAALVCEVGDTGVVDDALIGRRNGFAAPSRERGIRLANELCDLVQVRSSAGGTTVRLHAWL
jgi:predicted small metal-binding protein